MFLIIYAMDVSFLIAARFLSGFAAGGLFVVIPLYAVEIAEDRNRGALGAIFLLFSSIGFLLGFILGYYLNYAMLPWALVILPFIFLCGFTFVPESPAYLMKKQKINVRFRYSSGLIELNSLHSLLPGSRKSSSFLQRLPRKRPCISRIHSRAIEIEE